MVTSFFDVCDGIFLNYNWTDENLANSAALAGKNARALDVFVGVDVFGRGCFGGGGLNMHKALEKISGHHLSAAIFAPGWSFECHKEEMFEEMDMQLWERGSEWFHYKAWRGDKKKRSSSHVNSDPSPTISHRILLKTDFSRGFGTHHYNLGKEVPLTWFDLSKTSYQPILFHKFIESHNTTPKEQTESKVDVDADAAAESFQVDAEEKEKFPKPNEKLWEAINLTKFERGDGFSGGGCLRLIGNEKKIPDYSISSPCCTWIFQDLPMLRVYAAWCGFTNVKRLRCMLHDVFSEFIDKSYIPLDVSVQTGNGNQPATFAILVAFKSDSVNGERPTKINKFEMRELIRVGVEMEMKHSESPELICVSTSNVDENVESIDLELELKLWDFIQDENIPDSENVTFQFQKKKIVKQELNGWELLCINFPTNPNSAKTLNGLRIGIGNSIDSDLLIGFLSLLQLRV